MAAVVFALHSSPGRIFHPQLPSLLCAHSHARGSLSPSPLPTDAQGSASGSHVPRDPVAAPGCAPSPASPSAPCQAGCSKWSVRSSNRAWFCSGAPCLSLELSFCSHCPWLFPSPSAFGFPLAREGEKSSTRRGMTKWMLLSSSSSAFLQHQDADAKWGVQVTSLALMMFFILSLLQRGFGPRGEGQVWGAVQQRGREGQGVVCEIRERPGKAVLGRSRDPATASGQGD